MKPLSILLLVFLAPMKIVLAQDETTEEPDISKGEFLAEVNKIRRAFAKQHKLANMHELTWNQTLADEVLIKMREGRITSDFNIAQVWGYKWVLEETNKMVSKLLEDKNHVWEAREEPIKNYLLPTNRFIGCETIVFCYFYPDTDNNFDEMFKVKGEPGSKCDNGYGNNDGLCSPIGSFSTKSPTTLYKNPSESKDNESGDKAVTDSEASSSSPLVFYTLSALTSCFLVLF